MLLILQAREITTNQMSLTLYWTNNKRSKTEFVLSRTICIHKDIWILRKSYVKLNFNLCHHRQEKRKYPPPMFINVIPTKRQGREGNTICSFLKVCMCVAQI